jgi:hypothetical protein
MTIALSLTFSPGEKEQRSHSSDFADDQSANPVAGIRKIRQTILPLPEGEGRGESERENQLH